MRLSHEELGEIIEMGRAFETEPAEFLPAFDEEHLRSVGMLLQCLAAELADMRDIFRIIKDDGGDCGVVE